MFQPDGQHGFVPASATAPELDPLAPAWADPEEAPDPAEPEEAPDDGAPEWAPDPAAPLAPPVDVPDEGAPEPPAPVEPWPMDPLPDDAALPELGGAPELDEPSVPTGRKSPVQATTTVERPAAAAAKASAEREMKGRLMVNSLATRSES